MEIKRNIINTLAEEISEPKISILLGARQVGKTTLLHQLENEAHKMGISTTFYDLESSSDLIKLSGDQEVVIKQMLSGGRIVFIDEFHYLKNASKIFKAIYDQEAPIKIFASGSSSLEIHKHLKESLAGRFYKTRLFPLAFSEWLQVPKTDLNNYLQWGGMPGLINCKSDEERTRLLENIVSTYITKDIKGLLKEENIRAFNLMLYWLASHQGSLVVKSELAKEVRLSEPTVARHLEILSQTYVCHILNSYSSNLANELKKSIKVYLFDIGIRNSLLKDFRRPDERDDKGFIHETYVYLNLYRQLKANMEIRFWRTKKGDEVDFILLKNRIPVPVEVKSDINDLSIPNGIRAFIKIYKQSPFGIVYNRSIEGLTEFEGKKIYFENLEKSENVEYLKSVL